MSKNFQMKCAGVSLFCKFNCIIIMLRITLKKPEDIVNLIRNIIENWFFKMSPGSSLIVARSTWDLWTFRSFVKSLKCVKCHACVHAYVVQTLYFHYIIKGHHSKKVKIAKHHFIIQVITSSYPFIQIF